MICKIMAVFILLFSLIHVAHAEYKHCLFKRAVDGDTVIVEVVGEVNGKLKLRRVRVANIDAPESGQRYGDYSTKMMLKRCSKSYLWVKFDGQGVYGRDIGLLDCGGDVGLWLVKQGAAHPYHDAPKQYFKAVRKAIKSKRGLWASQSVIHPKAWRDGERKGKPHSYFLELYS